MCGSRDACCDVDMLPDDIRGTDPIVDLYNMI